ncbi:MAG: glycosyltransferase [Thiobacillus sp.]|nr:glycosyltransferase [Thiobacillus sp.]
MFIVMLQFYSATPAPDMHEMAMALRGWGHRVLVATPNRQGDLCFDEAGIETARIPGPKHELERIAQFIPVPSLAGRLARFFFMIRIRAHLDVLQPDILQVNPTALAFLLPLFRRKRSVYLLDVRQAGEVAGDDFLGRIRNWRTVLKHRLNARIFYDHACFASEAAAERILGPCWSRWATVHRVGQDPSFLSYQWPEGRLPSRMGPVRFVYIGTLSRVRQLELLLASIRQVAATRQDFSVDFIGPDAATGHYQRLVDEWRLGGIVRFLPPVPYSQVAETVAAYDVALAYVPPLPDWRYQPTLKVLEYRALGIPVLASDNAANRPIIQEDVNGLLVAHMQDSIARGLMRYVSDRDFLLRVSENARRNRQGRTWADSAKEYLDIVYTPLLQTIEKLTCK